MQRSSSIYPSSTSAGVYSNASSSDAASSESINSKKSSLNDSNLFEMVQEAKLSSWKNVTGRDLSKQELILEHTQMIGASLRNKSSPINIFRKFFTDEFIQHLQLFSSTECKHQNKLKKAELNLGEQGRKVTISTIDIWNFIAFLVEVCANQVLELKNHLKTSRMKTNQYKRVRKAFKFAPRTLFDIFNYNVMHSITLSGVCVTR
jgi:hypothetical protein